MPSLSLSSPRLRSKRASSVGAVFTALRGHIVAGARVRDLFTVTPASRESDVDILVSVARDMVARDEVPMLRFHRDAAGVIQGVVLARAERK